MTQEFIKVPDFPRLEFFVLFQNYMTSPKSHDLWKPCRCFLYKFNPFPPKAIHIILNNIDFDYFFFFYSFFLSHRNQPGGLLTFLQALWPSLSFGRSWCSGLSASTFSGGEGTEKKTQRKFNTAV